MRPIFRLCALCVIAGFSLPGIAFADTAPDQIVGTASITTDYRYRGISENALHVTPQGSVTWSGQSGFYAGTWLSEVDWSGIGHPFLEADWYAGKHFDLDGSDLDAEAYYYSYLRRGDMAANYFEGILHLSHNFGPAAVTLIGAVSPEWSNGTGSGIYVGGTAAYPVTDWLTVSSNLGHQWVQQAPSGYAHYDLGLTATEGSISADLRYVGNDIKADDALFWVGSSPQQAKAWTGNSVVLTLSCALPLL